MTTLPQVLRFCSENLRKGRGARWTTSFTGTSSLATGAFFHMNLHYGTKMDLGKTVSMGSKLLWGVLSGRISYASLKRLLAASSTADKIRSLYRQFPESPGEFEPWLAQVKPLWGEA